MRIPILVSLALGPIACIGQSVASRYDVLITELMSDPLPVVGLPPAEYVELTNVSGKSLDLKGWRISDGSGSAVIQVSQTMAPGGRVILSGRTHANALATNGTAIGLSGFPSLDNDGDRIVLTSPEGMTVHAVTYHPSWHANDVKRDGGWSLEMIDTGLPCLGADNWTSSTDPSGGTPGRRNSVDGKDRDSTAPRLVRTYSIDSLSVVAVFSETLDSVQSTDRMRYEIDRQMGHPVSVSAMPPHFSEVMVGLPRPMAPKTVYILSVTSLRDCAGNAMDTRDWQRAGLPERPTKGQMRINELLFNPRNDGSDYAELLNLGPSIVDASSLFLANGSGASQSGSPVRGSDKPWLLFPGDHAVFTPDTAALMRQFPRADPALSIQTRGFPSMPDDAGVLRILDDAGTELDAFSFNARMHHPLVFDREGVALERVDPRSPTKDPSNWTSASSDAGYGSPTRKNSQYAASDTLKGEMRIHPMVVSPDTDGIDDFTTLQYRFKESGYSCSVWVYDPFGRRVRAVARNALCGTEGHFRWNGLDESGRRLPTGPYYKVMEVTDLTGRTRIWKRPVAVAYRR